VGLSAAHDALAGYDRPWWIAGGWAIDLFVGGPPRRHDDVDVVVLRRDQHELAAHLDGWDIQVVAHPGELRPWRGELLEPPVHELWARPAPDGAWTCELLLDEADGDRWVFRRDARVTLPLAEAGVERDGLPVLAPEIVLLFKAKDPEPKDEADLAAALPLLSPAARAWLGQAIDVAYPEHPWRQRLA
jgi:Aminoglycoside-2''-adenylyltransferase